MLEAVILCYTLDGACRCGVCYTLDGALQMWSVLHTRQCPADVAWAVLGEVGGQSW